MVQKFINLLIWLTQANMDIEEPILVDTQSKEEAGEPLKELEAFMEEIGAKSKPEQGIGMEKEFEWLNDNCWNLNALKGLLEGFSEEDEGRLTKVFEEASKKLKDGEELQEEVDGVTEETHYQVLIRIWAQAVDVGVSSEF